MECWESYPLDVLDFVALAFSSRSELPHSAFHSINLELWVWEERVAPRAR